MLETGDKAIGVGALSTADKLTRTVANFDDYSSVTVPGGREALNAILHERMLERQTLRRRGQRLGCPETMLGGLVDLCMRPRHIAGSLPKQDEADSDLLELDAIGVGPRRRPSHCQSAALAVRRAVAGEARRPVRQGVVGMNEAEPRRLI